MPMVIDLILLWCIVHKKKSRFEIFWMEYWFFLLFHPDVHIDKNVDIGIDLHAKIMKFVRNSNTILFPLVRRVNRYYGDVLYDFDELPTLLNELKNINDISAREPINQIIDLCQKAISLYTGFETIAD